MVPSPMVFDSDDVETFSDSSAAPAGLVAVWGHVSTVETVGCSRLSLRDRMEARAEVGRLEQSRTVGE